MELETLKKLELGKFDSIQVYRENIDELNTIIQSYMDTPKHVVFNFDMLDDASEDFLDHLNFLSTLLKSNNYSLQIFSAPDSLRDKLHTHRFRNLPRSTDLAGTIMGLDKIELELRSESLLKSYVDETMKNVFSRSKLVIRRGELTIQDSPESFFSKVNYFQTFELADAFFSFVISSSEEFFGDFLKHLDERELAPIFNTIINKVPESLLSTVTIHDYLTHPYEHFTTEKMLIGGVEYDYFHRCVVMRVPLECSQGVFNLEVWIPKMFAKTIYKFLNP